MQTNSDLFLKAIVFGVFCVFVTLLCWLTIPSDTRMFAGKSLNEQSYDVTGIAW